MIVNRRFVLKGMALSGMAGLALSNAVPGLANPLPAASTPSAAHRPVIALSVRGAAETLFLQGAEAALGQTVSVHRPGQDLSSLLALERQLQNSQPVRVIGLLDDASATLTLDIARSAGARIQWLGHHHSTGPVTRHRLLSTDLSQTCSQSFNQYLNACSASYSRHDAFGAPSSGQHLSTAVHRSAEAPEWASSLGYLLASLGREPVMTAPVPSSNAPLGGSFVSFLIET